MRHRQPAPGFLLVPRRLAHSSNCSKARRGAAAQSPRRVNRGSATVAAVADDPAQVVVYGVTCPHCGKTFREELLTGPAERYHGFKCPHCRLFVPFERASEQNGAEPPPRSQ